MNMSCSAARESKAARKNCRCCQERKAKFQYGRVVRASRDHTLCFACYRSERERRRAHLLAGADRQQPPASPFDPPRRLSERDLTHRRAMLAHFRGQLG
jgi:hypothetical protein